jgi:hypothetical protein
MMGVCRALLLSVQPRCSHCFHTAKIRDATGMQSGRAVTDLHADQWHRGRNSAAKARFWPVWAAEFMAKRSARVYVGAPVPI